MKASIIDAIVTAWKNDFDILRYSEIKQHLVDKKIIRKNNDRSLSRWLKKLEDDEKIIKKVEDGYKLLMKPKAYQTFDYINELREKYPLHIYDGEVGGWISHLCASTYLNFNEELIVRPDEKLAFNEIAIRLEELFEALYLLKNDSVKRHCGLAHIKLNDIIVRETFFSFLLRDIGNHCATEKLIEKYGDLLRPATRTLFEKFWESNKATHSRNRVDFLGNDFFFDKIEENPKAYIDNLKKESSLDPKKYSIEELISKYAEINDWIQRNHKEELETKHHYALTPEESEAERNYRTLILAKVAQNIEALGTTTEDFGVILTRHPRTMNQFFTEEHILYEAMEWAREPPREAFLRKMWQEIKDDEKTFEGMVAERIVYYNNLNPKIIESLKSKPWVKKELSKYGSFNQVLRLYKLKYKKLVKQRAEDKKRIFSMLENMGAVFNKDEL